jgi:fatty aldehyde-generating acyl-ACP reductase
MNSFAFFISPKTFKQIADFWPIAKILPASLLHPFLKNNLPFKVAHIKIHPSSKKEILGHFIITNILPEENNSLNENALLNKIISAAHIAQHLNAGIMGLDRYSAIAAEKGLPFDKGLKIPLTSGSAYNAWSIFEGIYRIVRNRKIDFARLSLAIIGATNSIGSLCARKFSEIFSRMIIYANEKEQLQDLKQSLNQLNPVEVIIEQDIHKTINDAEVVVVTTDIKNDSLELKEFKQNAVVCDGSCNMDILSKAGARQDITIFAGGLIKAPFGVDKRASLGLPQDIISASLAETMLLTLEEKLVDYSMGDNINLDQMEEIADIAARHGFEVFVPNF